MNLKIWECGLYPTGTNLSWNITMCRMNFMKTQTWKHQYYLPNLALWKLKCIVT